MRLPFSSEEEVDQREKKRVLNSHHSFFGTAAAGDSSVAHQLRFGDDLIDEIIAAGDCETK